MKVCWRHSVAVAAALLLSLGGVAASIGAQTKPAASARPAAIPGRPPVLPTPPPSPVAVFETPARYALITEADTNTVLFDKNAEERMPPASMSKLMTAYVVFGMLKEGRITLGDEFPVSQKAWKLGG
jgi:D-alanyl-D-alanine carboxypeptidase (penicillin-binding protein 5/6)